VNNEHGQAFVYKNNSREINKNNYIAFVLKGKAKNTFAIGSKIKLYADKEVFYRELIPSRGFQSSVEYKQTIGLGKLKQLDSAVITWPDHTITRIDHPPINQVHELDESQVQRIPEPETATPAVPALMTKLKSSFDKHEEDNNIDFYYEHNVPKMISREGPKATVGDVNGDGLEDIYIGGTPVHPGQLYLQTASGGFEKKDEPGFLPFRDFEDEAVLFFDADHDGDLDLFVGAGGNNNLAYSAQMQNRLFLNDSKGNFSIDPNAFPKDVTGANTGIALAADFNHDGFLDLFVGGRSVPREYGSPPVSFLYINDGKGHFTDIAATKNPDIAHIGMVTGASWVDMDGDGQNDLVICGEWMSPHIFSYKQDRFVELKTNLQNLYGWWESVATTDLNGDGKPDLILGNIGENFYLHPDSARPVKLWVSDFDGNGTVDNILSGMVDGKDMPVFLKHDMEIQFPSLKKQNLKNDEYAKKTIQDLFGETQLKSSLVKQFNYCSSIVALNLGNGQFRIQKLPPMIQLSSVNAIRCADLNGDGSVDLVLGGNEFGFLPQFGRLDASFGQVLINDGHGNLKCMDAARTGIEAMGQTRDIALFKDLGRTRFLFLINDEYPVMYQLNTGR
ncbi:MAG TPA: FG-GAP-like repeat-containing protein, partial [Puia sp.]|nr:FG-GAP-like repeat-containing protein [Puia sp.]